MWISFVKHLRFDRAGVVTRIPGPIDIVRISTGRVIPAFQDSPDDKAFRGFLVLRCKNPSLVESALELDEFLRPRIANERIGTGLSV